MDLKDYLKEMISNYSDIIDEVKEIDEIGFNRIISNVKTFLYQNIIDNYFFNIRKAENISEYNIDEKAIDELELKFENLLELIEILSDDDFDEDENEKISDEMYKDFESKIKNYDTSCYNFLLELKKILEFKDCLKLISEFNQKYQKKLVKLHLDYDNDSISIGY